MWMAGVSVAKTVQPARISAMTEWTCSFKLMRKTSVNKVCQQHTFDDCNAHAFV